LYVDGHLCCLGGEELGRGEQSGADTDGNDDMTGSSRRAPGDRLHRETDADVAFDSERDRQPDTGVAACISQLMADERLVGHVSSRRPCNINMDGPQHASQHVIQRDCAVIDRNTCTNNARWLLSVP